MRSTHCDPSGSDMRSHNTQDRHHGRSWVTISYDESSGEVSEDSSPNMRPYRNEILQEAKAKFRERIQNDMLRGRPEEHASASRSQSTMSRRGDEGGGVTNFEDGVKRSRSATVQLEVAREPAPRPLKAGRMVSKQSLRARESVSLNASFSSQVEQDDIPGERMVQHPISSREIWERWMYNALCALQQLGCRTMAKEWIKAIHPKKQSTNPYNGRNPKTGKMGDPDDIKPAYWPKDVVHREPDHIHKEERLKLLIHLLMTTPHKVLLPVNETQNTKEIVLTAQSLMSALHGKFENTKYGLKNKKSIVQKMVEVRTYLEQYEEGGLSGNTEIGVPDYACSRRNNKNDDDDEDGAVQDELEVIPDYEEYHEDVVDIPAPTGIDPSSSGNEAPEVPQVPPLEKPDEPRRRSKGKRKSKRATARSNTEPTPSNTYSSWDASRLPSDYGMQAAQMPGYDGLPHHPIDNNGVAMAQQMQHHPMSWDPMNGPVPFQPQFHDPNLGDHRVVANISVDPSQFMGREYTMMPPQQFCGGPHPQSHPHPYFQQSPGGSMPFHYDPSPMQGFDQGAYFPATSRPPM